jgi:dTDP-4-amino-4,6-dideoxygalactose transaminase
VNKIQLFRPQFHVEECLAEIRECLEVGWTGIGFKTNQFEKAWKESTGLPFAYFLNSNTAGLHLALRIFKSELGWQDGDEVITTPLTFVSTNHAILYERLRPVFADVDETLCLDPRSIEQKITPKTRAVMFVGMAGNAGRLNDVRALCSKRGLKLILDAAHMAGTYYQKKHAGHGTDCAVFSFQAVKNLPSADSGMICFSDGALDARVRKEGWLGIDKDTFLRTGTGPEKGHYQWEYNVPYVGLKAHGNSVIAAICLVQLKYLEADNKRRRELCRIYEDSLGEHPRIRFSQCLPDCLSSRHLFQIRVPETFRDPLILFLNQHDIFPGVHYRINSEYPMYRYALGTCPNAERAAREVVSLPLHLGLKNKEAAFISEKILGFLK